VNAAGQNRAARRGWTKRVQEARDVFAEIPMGEDEAPIKVYIPDTETLEAFFTARHKGSTFGALGALMGEDNVARLRDSAKRAAGEDGRVPITVWRDLLEDVMEDLGLGAANPER
jgi:hypothetical protein